MKVTSRAHVRITARVAGVASACLVSLVLAGSVVAQSPTATPRLWADGTSPTIAAGWRVVGLPSQKPPLTAYVPERIDGRRALRLDADRSYGNFVLPLAGGSGEPRRIDWSWRTPGAAPGADLRSRSSDDAPARVCLTFDWPDTRVPFVERQLLRLARSLSRDDLPGATLCWVWGGAKEAQGDLLDSPYTRRVRVIVLRTAADAGVHWHDESRDVDADLRRAFGDELRADEPLPKATSLIVSADADNTQTRTRAWVAELRTSP